jgi:hypothetical protein
MNQFSLLPSASKGLRKGVLIRLAIAFGVVLTMVFIVPMIMAGSMEIDRASIIMILLLFTVLFPITYKTSIRRLESAWSTYKLTIGSNSITRESKNTPTIVIPFDEVKEIVRNADGSYVVKGSSLLNAIGVPVGVERAEELEALLGAVKPITRKTQVSPWQRFQYVGMVAGAGIWFAAFVVNNKFVATIAGIVFVGLMGYTKYVVQYSKNVDKRTRWSMYVAILPVIAVIIRLIALWNES